MLTIGIKTPAFTLPNTIKEQVSSEQFIGKNLVLFFFPMAWTNTCTKEMCTIQEERNIYADLNTAVVGISVDTLFALKRFGEDYKIEFLLLSDFNKVVIHDFHVVHHDFNWGYKNVA